MNFTSPNGESDDGGELYEPHDARSRSSNNGEPPRLLTSKEKVFELQQLLEEQNLQ